MLPIRRLIPVLVVTSVLSSRSQSASEATDQDKIQGTWKVVSLQADGEHAPPDVLARLKFFFKGARLTIAPGEPGFANYTFQLRPDATPPGFEMTHADGKHAGLTLKGHYVLRGDDLRISFADDEQQVKKRNSPPAGRTYLLRREKP